MIFFAIFTKYKLIQTKMKFRTYLFALILSAPFFGIAQTVKQEWFKEFPNKNETVDLRVQTDSEGFIYIAGTFDSGNHGIDWYLIKLSPAGDTILNLVLTGPLISKG
jgi:hypothetical protein